MRVFLSEVQGDTLALQSTELVLGVLRSPATVTLVLGFARDSRDKVV